MYQFIMWFAHGFANQYPERVDDFGSYSALLWNEYPAGTDVWRYLADTHHISITEVNLFALLGATIKEL